LPAVARERRAAMLLARQRVLRQSRAASLGSPFRPTAAPYHIVLTLCIAAKIGRHWLPSFRLARAEDY